MDYPNELRRKLGLKANMNAVCLNAPDEYQTLLPELKAISNIEELGNDLDWIQAFYFDKSQAEADLANLKAGLSTSGQLWLCWPKKSSGIESDLTDDVVRAFGLAVGLVDVKVVAINSSWSGLKFVYRLKDR